MSLIRLEKVTKLYDPDLILDDISVSIEHGDRIGLIGRNGTGKTTLIKIINGMLANFKGKVVSAKGLRIGYLSQEPDLARDCTLRQEMLKVFEKRRALEDKMLLLAEEMETEEAPHLLEAYARIQEQHERLGGYDYEHQVNRILGGLGFPEQDFNLPIRVLSGGQKSRATLAKLLLEEPDLRTILILKGLNGSKITLISNTTAQSSLFPTTGIFWTRLSERFGNSQNIR